MAQHSYTDKSIKEAVSNTLTNHPFFAHLLLSMASIHENPSIKTARTNGVDIEINPKWFSTMPVRERVFVLAHECMHMLLGHIPRARHFQLIGMGPDGDKYDHHHMNKSQDYVINYILNDSKVGKMPKSALYYPQYDDTWQAENVYCDLEKEDDPPDDQGGGGDGQGFDEHDTSKPPSREYTEGEMKSAAIAARDTAKARGKLPAGLDRLVGTLVEPVVDWKKQLRDEISSCMGHDDLTWARPHRRRLVMNPSVYFPGTQGHRSGQVAVVVDTSGSVSVEEFNIFMSELGSILDDARPEQCLLYWVDAKVHGDPVDLTDADGMEVELLRGKGGGGTDMEAAWPAIHRDMYAPTMAVVFTDGYTPTSKEKEPSFPVLWVTTDSEELNYGTVIKYTGE